MAILPIIEVPDPRLRQISTPVEAVNDEIRALIADMFETMYAAPGIGLAAVQIGVPKRVLVIDLQEPVPSGAEGPVPSGAEGPVPSGAEGPVPSGAEGPEEEGGEPVRDPRVFINPEIITASEQDVPYTEGCLSVPEQFAEVDRPDRIRARWLDEHGAAHEEDIDGMLAVCLQHEMDHLQGILFIDHLSRLKREMILRKIAKARKEHAKKAA